MTPVPFLGPAGIQRRIAEIERRIEEKTGIPANPDAAPDAFPSPLAGPIAENGGYAPFNPFAPGLSLEGTPNAERFGPLARQAAQEAGIDPALFEALVASESAYDPNARSRAGALGLSQLMPDTAAALGVANPFDPAQNLRGGAQYLSQMLQRFNGDVRLALAAYNAGPSAVEKFGGIPPYRETERYVRNVMGLFEARRQP